MTWQVYVRDFQVPMDNEILRPYSAVTLSADTLPDLIQKIDNAVMCNGNFDTQFIEIAQVRKGTEVVIK